VREQSLVAVAAGWRTAGMDRRKEKEKEAERERVE
jgi:hypothetical protein